MAAPENIVTARQLHGAAGDRFVERALRHLDIGADVDAFHVHINPGVRDRVFALDAHGGAHGFHFGELAQRHLCASRRRHDDALRAIRFAREQGRPFLGTCGGFQHAILEYARHVLGWADAEHAETKPNAARPVITPLACALVEKTDTIRFHEGSILAAAYGCLEASEGYHCSYGINPAFMSALVSGPLRVSAEDQTGEVRAVELEGHPFFVATLFQPERAALIGKTPPLVAAFVRATGARPGGKPT